MKIEDLISLLEQLKNNNVTDVYLEKSSIIENVCNDFRSGVVWLNGYDDLGRYIDACEVDVEL